jgi:pyruvate dehydrogenase E2 component (dihydrolipoamide acetyltransferase)
MAYQLELPDIGEGVVEAEVQQWFVKAGDRVVEDQPIVEVMTDKATVTIPSPRRGRILKLFWNVGDVAKVHAPLVEMELEDAPAARPQPASSRPEPARAPEPAVPATPTESARADFGAPHSGATATGFQDAAPGHKALATPAVRALAREMGVDVNAVEGTGPGGRVTKDDLRAFRAQTNGQARPAASAAPTATPARAPPSPRPPAHPERSAGAAGAESKGPPAERGERGSAAGAAEERIPLRGLRKRIAENMARSKRTAAHFTFVEQCDVTELVRVKDRIAAAAQEEGVKMTFLPFVVKSVVAALRKHPMLNAALDEEHGEIVVKRRYDLGIASATENGLVVPVVRGADQRSLLDLAREIERLAADSKAGRSRPEDMGNSTFTITSLGALGGLFATPVLNHPEVGILGVHRIRPTPVVKDGQVVVRDVMHVSVTSDHRVVDGDEAARFAYDVIRYLEDPNLLFMQMV